MMSWKLAGDVVVIFFATGDWLLMMTFGVRKLNAVISSHDC